VVRELLGPRDLSYREATRILGNQVGRPDLQYVQLSDEDMARILVLAGMSDSFARLYVEMTRALSEGKINPQKGRTTVNTTPTRFEAFTAELARAYADAA